MKLSVVMPVYNEEATVGEIVRRVLDSPVDELELVIVDDGSTDGTREKIEELVTKDKRIKAIYQGRNQGKGAAIKAGLQAAEGDVVIIQDADLEYDPADYPALMEPIRRGDADAVFGSRFLGPHRCFSLPQYIANVVITRLFSLLFGTALTDVETCYKCFRRELIDPGRLRSSRFEVEIEIAARLIRGGARIFEVPIYYAGRSYAEGKKIRWYDGFAAVWAVLRWRVARL